MRVRFGDCVLDTDSRQLFRGIEAVHLSPKAFELLTLLVTNRPKALSKRQLHEAIWSATFVTDDSLARLITEIRAAIGDDAREARFVRTVYGFGYAFADSATVVGDSRDLRPSRGRKCWLMSDGREIVLADGENVIGRDPDAAVSLESTRVSRRHARIVVKDGDAMLEDAGSKNGTYLQGERIKTPTALSNGDAIRIGPFLLTFHARPAGAPTETESE
jgi:DNA-binding winged helix-turn-helix (wHTH) protein